MIYNFFYEADGALNVDGRVINATSTSGIMQQDRSKIQFYQVVASLLLLLQVLIPTNATGAEHSRDSSSEILQLQGPRNTSVETGVTAQLSCRLLEAKTQPRKAKFHFPVSASSSIRFVPWRASGNQRVSVQWNIDGFGFTNDSLMESYGGRYIMPGPLSDGQFPFVMFLHALN